MDSTELFHLTKKIPPGIQKKTFRSIMEIPSGIERIEPLIHQSKFSGDYGYGEVEKAIGKLKIDDRYAAKATKKNYSYKKRVYIRFKKRLVYFLFKTPASYSDPQLGYLKPRCILETSDSTPEFLAEIDRVLPGLKVMSLEYAIDFYCQNHHQVADLFFFLRRFAFIPRAKRTSMAGGEFSGYDYGNPIRETNAVYRIHFQEKKVGTKFTSGKYVKFYERGDDKARKTLPNGKKGWDHQDTNRVRFEVTFNRKNGTLARNGISTWKT